MGNKTEKLFLDTSFLFAWLNENDKFHIAAHDLIESLKNKQVLFFLTDYIVDEFLTLVLVRAGKTKAIEVADKIMEACQTDPHLKLIYVEEPLFLKAMEIFCAFKDKSWSFTDCTSYVVMKNLQISQGASFDKHFRDFGFEVLP